MSRFTTIFWDVDNTLLDFDYSQRHALADCFLSVGREITEEEIALYKRINDDYWRRLELGEVTREQLLKSRFVEFFQEVHLTGADVEIFRRQYQAALGSVFCFLDDALTICRTLQGYMKQYVVTNGMAVTQRSKLELSGLAEVMDGIFISEEIGSPKPHRQFFDYCLEHVEEKNRSKILIVGDSLTSDIRGGIQSGIATCWYHRGNFSGEETACRPDYTISDLHRVYDIAGISVRPL